MNKARFYDIQILLFSVLWILHSNPSGAQQLIPEVELIELQSGKKISTNDFQGKVIYLDFWASWCVPCRKSFPFMNQLRERFSSDELAIVAVNMDKDIELARQFLTQYPPNFKVYQNSDKVLSKQLDLPGLPVAYIIDRQGVIKARHIGFNERKVSKKIKQIKQLLSTSISQ